LLAVFVVWRSVVGFQQARLLHRLLRLPRRQGLACPACGAAPPLGACWRCEHCPNTLDVFACNGICPQCGGPDDFVPCIDCGVKHPLLAWYPAAQLAPEGRPEG
jgi:hypothetical protein